MADYGTRYNKEQVERLARDLEVSKTLMLIMQTINDLQVRIEALEEGK